MEVKELAKREKVGDLEYGTIFKIGEIYFMVVSFNQFYDDVLDDFLSRHEILTIKLEDGEIEEFLNDTEVEVVANPIVLG